MKAAAVAIGVNRTGGLTPLRGAVDSALGFSEWAKRHDMDVSTLTDLTDKVQLTQILKVIQPIVESKTYEKLIVFFSGHGFLLGPQSEVWLLSDAPDLSHEAINVDLTRLYARYCGIPHVIFIGDACRSGGPNHTHRSVQGSAIFPNPSNWNHDGEIDTFYATRPGDPALEFKDDTEAVANFKGIFSECLLDALKGNKPDVIIPVAKNGKVRRFIPSRTLKYYLINTVPERAAEISIKLQQDPEIRVESSPPKVFAELEPEDEISGSGFAKPPESMIALSRKRIDIEMIAEHAQDKVISGATHADLLPVTYKNTDVGRRFTNQIDALINANTRESFETMCGFTINRKVNSVTTGAAIESMVDIIDQGDTTHLRVNNITHENISATILIELESGNGVVLAIKPNFIGTIYVDDDQVVNVNYTPSSNTELFHHEYQNMRDHVDRRRAFAATATRNGVFDVSGQKTKSASYLRMMKKIDPTLGIYAAYAYNNIGRVKDIRDILGWMKNDPPPIPFDVALLARPQEWPKESVAPFCPMLRQGWTLLDLHPASAEGLREYRSMLLPGLWTMFSSKGVQRIRNDLETGELR